MTVLIVARGQSLIDQIVSRLKANGISAAGTTDDRQAISQIESGEISTIVVGGGVEQESRARLNTAASRNGVRVIEGGARGKDIEAYVRDELLPALKRS